MRKLESSQKDESRAQSADSSKAYRKRRAFYCLKCDMHCCLPTCEISFLDGFHNCCLYKPSSFYVIYKMTFIIFVITLCSQTWSFVYFIACFQYVPNLSQCALSFVTLQHLPPKVLTSRQPVCEYIVPGNRSKTSSFQLPYSISPSADCARELFKPSKDSASLLVCTRKKFF